MKIILKGVQTPEDALIAAELGVDALIISNHGGRQLDTAPSSLEMLYYINLSLRSKNYNKIEIYFDGGIRRGSDVFKAIAFGASAVFLGRPIIWGLACGGKEGILKVMEILMKEFIITMKLCGCNSIKDINETYLKLPYFLTCNVKF